MHRHLALPGAYIAIVDWSEKLYERTRTRGHQIAMPIGFGHRLLLTTRGRSYRELVGAPKDLDDTDWIIDEFDHNFNALAIASLRYHLDFSVCDNSDRREVYEDLIARLAEPPPDFADTPEEEAIATPPRDGLREWFNRERSPEYLALSARYRKREADYQSRIQQARHNFVDIMPQLWS
ncbi:hypothetical protein [Mycolicibacterium llatzerense]|uniref:hypothetical protein n=1 Tax=Mycolicibacterium llatzerense TaxID=280871 RepID=UPI0021B5EDD7|nr:hypothetical protein [Mycolicibacterium llatzerense]MCT7363987.1 hypothetical protein [Mycolicibacterium llatzerense]